jgi:Reverse transcriptase (RNA-dependent DNA polymerase)
MMSILLGLETKQVDYVAACVQADIDTTVDVEMPTGFAQHGKEKSLYWLRQSPRNHFNNLSAKLNALGFLSCDTAPCLFVSDKCICLVYVDDTLIFARTQEDIENAIRGLKKSCNIIFFQQIHSKVFEFLITFSISPGFVQIEGCHQHKPGRYSC